MCGCSFTEQKQTDFMKKLLFLMCFCITVDAAETAIRGAVAFPSLPLGYTTTIGFGNVLLDAEGEKASMVFQAPKAGNIDRIEFLTGTVTTGGDMDVRLETVDTANGDPTGTLASANANVTVNIANTDDDTWKSGTLTSASTVTKGQLLAAVIVAPAAANLNIRNFADSNFGGFPYRDSFLGGAWAKGGNPLCIAIRYSDATYATIQGVFPFNTAVGSGFNSGSTSDERGLSFRLSVPAKTFGWWAWLDGDGDFSVKLYNASDTVLATNAFLFTSAVRADANATIYSGTWNTAVSLSKDTEYRITLLPESVTSITSQNVTVANSNLWTAVDGGFQMFRTERTDAGAWTDTHEGRLMMGLLLESFDDGTGAGGGGSAAYSYPIGQ